MYNVINMPDLGVRYFSSMPWLVAFIISVIFLFFRVNKARKRAIVAAVAVFFLFINTFFIKVFSAFDQNATFYRHLWAIPTMSIIAITVIDIIGILPKRSVKILGIIIFGIFLIYVNSQEYIRCREQTFSTDAKMVPQDVIELGNKLGELRKKRGKDTLFVLCPDAYQKNHANMCTELDLYSGFVNITYSSILNDSSHNGESELMGSNPDVTYIMSTCCSNGIDYVIVSNHEKTEKAFREEGYVPLLKSEGFMLFFCEGYCGYTQDLTSWWQISRKSWYNEKGEAVLNADGYCTVEYEYDHSGRLISERCFDVDGNLVNNRFMYAQCIYKYDKNSLIEIRFYDSNGKPCVRYDDMCGIIKYSWNDKDQLIMLRYYNDKEELINYDFQNPRAITKYQYDENGNQISEKYFNTEEMPSVALAGYDEIRKTYDENHRVILLGYYADGELINRFDLGYAEIVYEYNDAGELISTKYMDSNGNIIIPEIT